MGDKPFVQDFSLGVSNYSNKGDFENTIGSKMQNNRTNKSLQMTDMDAKASNSMLRKGSGNSSASSVATKLGGTSMQIDIDAANEDNSEDMVQ